MTRLLAIILAAMLSFALLPQLLVTEAYAKGLPPFDENHNFGMFLKLLLVPLGAAMVVLGVWAMRSKGEQARQEY